MCIKSMSHIVDLAKSKEKKVLAVAAAEDEPVLKAVKEAMEEGIVTPILVGDKEKIVEIAKNLEFDLTNVEVINEKDPAKASKEAVRLIRDGKAHILMKGLVKTAYLLRAVLDKENGLRGKSIISHIAFFETKTYHKVFAVTDAAMNIAPDLNEKVSIINNAVAAFNKLGVEKPKIAAVAAVEVVNPKMPATLDAAMLTQMNRRGQIKNCIIDGPLAVDNAVSKEACEHKGIVTEVGGDPDIILAPNIETGNALYKALNFLADADSAGIIMGAQVPIVLTSRADSDRAKLLSIACAAAMD